MLDDLYAGFPTGSLGFRHAFSSFFQVRIKIFELQKLAYKIKNRTQCSIAKFHKDKKRQKVEPDPPFRLIAGISHLVLFDLVFYAPIDGIAKFDEVEMVFMRHGVIESDVIISAKIPRYQAE